MSVSFSMLSSSLSSSLIPNPPCSRSDIFFLGKFLIVSWKDYFSNALVSLPGSLWPFQYIFHNLAQLISPNTIFIPLLRSVVPCVLRGYIVWLPFACHAHPWLPACPGILARWIASLQNWVYSHPRPLAYIVCLAISPFKSHGFLQAQIKSPISKEFPPTTAASVHFSGVPRRNDRTIVRNASHTSLCVLVLASVFAFVPFLLHLRTSKTQHSRHSTLSCIIAVALQFFPTIL